MNLLPEVPSQNSSDDPLYNIGVVTRLTGISMATLRAWERRYDFPEASRTSGGHRLYSERDILRLRWVKSRIAEGMQTAQAIQALRVQEATAHFAPEKEVAPLPPPVVTGEKSALISYQHQLYDFLLQRDLARADQILGEALAVSSPEELIIHVIGPTMAAIGDAWENNQVSIAVEHLATNFLRQRLLMWMVSGPPAQPAPPIVLACAPNEFHEGSLMMLGALLRRRRWSVAYLGQAVPLPDLASFIRDIKPSLVILVAMTENSASELAEWPQYMPDIAQAGKPVICYGGRVFARQREWQLRVPGIYLGDTIEAGITRIEQLLS